MVTGAVWKGHTYIVKTLLDAGATMDGTKALDMQTYLQGAIYNDQFDIARLLIKRGADVNAAPGRFKPPLCLACGKGNLELARLLLDGGADVYAKSYTGERVRQCAIESGAASIPQLLDEAEGKTTQPRNRPLHHHQENLMSDVPRPPSRSLRPDNVAYQVLRLVSLAPVSDICPRQSTRRLPILHVLMAAARHQEDHTATAYKGMLAARLVVQSGKRQYVELNGRTVSCRY